jgi:hypothetical protein
VYPGPTPAITLVDWHCCLYLADAPIGEAEVLALIETLGRTHDWTHVEKLRHAEALRRCAGAPDAPGHPANRSIPWLQRIGTESCTLCLHIYGYIKI